MLRRIAENSGWWLGERCAAIGLAVVTSVALTRALGPGTFGELSYLLALVGLAAPLTQFGLSGLVTRALLEDPAEEREAVGAALALRLLGGLTALGAGVIYGLAAEPAGGRRWLLWLLFAVQPVALYQVLEFWFQARFKAGSLVPWRLVVAGLSTLAKVGVAVATRSLAWVAVAYAAETVAAGIASGLAYRRAAGHWARPLLAPTWLRWYGLRSPWLLLSGIAEVIYLRIDIVMLERMRGPVETGIYAVAARLSEIWYSVPVLIAASLFPLLWERRPEPAAYQRALQGAFDLLCWLAIVLAVAIQWLAAPLIGWLFGAAYLPAVPILQLHIWAGVFVFMRAVLSRWLLAEDLLKFSLMTHAVGALVNVGLNLLLISRFGGIGAAMATVISYGTAGFGALFLAARTRRIGWMMAKALLLPLRFVDIGRYARLLVR